MAHAHDHEDQVDLTDATSAQQIDGYICEHGTAHLRLWRDGKVFAIAVLPVEGFAALVSEMVDGRQDGPGTVGHA